MHTVNMSWSDIGKNIIKSAPLLGTALMGPAGGAVGTLIASAFDADPTNVEDILTKVSTDPNSLIKLKEIEANNKNRLSEIALEEYKAALQDKASARNRE